VCGEIAANAARLCDAYDAANSAKADYDWAPTFNAASSQLLPIINTYARKSKYLRYPCSGWLSKPRPVSKFTCLSVAGPIRCFLGMYTWLR